MRDFTAIPSLWAIARSPSQLLTDFERRMSAESAKWQTAAPAPKRAPAGVAVIPIRGVIGQRGWWVDTSTEDVGAALDKLVADDAVGSIVLDIDSPGGTVYGVPELAAKIRASRGQKTIIAAVNSSAFSAAYWLASQASVVTITPSGQTGSIGVFSVHEDVSGMLEQAGVKITFIKRPDAKTEGNPYEPLGEEAKAAAQADVDAYYSMFVADVAAGRGVTKGKVESDFGQGRTVMARDAVAAGMADSIGTLPDVLATIARGGELRRRRAAAARAKRILQIAEAEL